MIVRDVRMAGFKYFGDNIKTTNAHAPIIITKSSNFATECDKIEIVYGDVNYNASGSPKYTYERFKVSYFCETSQIIDKAKSKGNNVSFINALAVYKKKEKC